MKPSFIIFLILVLSSSIAAQTNLKYCEYKVGASYQEEIKSSLSGISEDHQLGLTSIPVGLTFLMKSDSTSVYYSGLEQQIMDSLSTHFLPSGIHLYLARDPFFIYEDLVYDFVVGENTELFYPGLQNNRINIVITNSISYANGAGLCGIAQIFPNTVFSRYSCIPSNTISHEIGHELSLAHTHHTTFGVELVDGSNCDTAGDLICDTPADPNRSDLVSNDCIWEGTYEDANGYDIHLVDANGDRYDPDVSNLMSYYGVLGCRNDFTLAQSALMQNRIAQKLITYGYETPKMIFDVYDREDLCENGYKVSASVKNPASNVEYQWDFDSDGTFDEIGEDAQYLYTEYGDYTIKLTMTYADGRQYHQSKVCIVNYSNEFIAAPFLDDFEEDLDRKYVKLVEETPYKWNLGLKLTNGRKVAGDQIHINENSIMEYKVDVSEVGDAVLEFEYDCNTNAVSGGDSLLIELINCDESIKLFERWGQNLGTAGEYRTIVIPLPQMDSDILTLKFTSKGDADQWHDLYIDNIQIYENNLSKTNNTDNQKLKVYPNPTNASIQINLNVDKLYLVDIFGNTVNANYTGNKLDLSDLANGIYILNVFSDETWYQQKILKAN